MSISIIAFSDIHSPIYTKELLSILKDRCKNYHVDVLLMAGDVVSEGKWQNASYIEDVSSICEAKKFLGVFGNEDYEESRDKIKEMTPSVEWLEDKRSTFTLSGLRVSVFGSIGILDEPTRWQTKNIPHILEVYKTRLEALKSHCIQSRDSDINIVLMHYPPTYSTLLGEPTWAWKQMGSKRAESIIINECTFGNVFHGHAHNSKSLVAHVKDVIFTNVAFPARRDVVYVQLSKKIRLDTFFHK